MQMPAFLTRFTMKQQLVEPQPAGEESSTYPVPSVPRAGQQPPGPALLVTARRQMKEPIS